MKLFVIFLLIFCGLSVYDARPFQLPTFNVLKKLDLGMILNPNIINKETYKMQVIPGEAKTFKIESVN